MTQVTAQPVSVMRDRLTGVVSAHRSKLALLAVILVIVIVAASRSSIFLSWANFQNILVQCSIIGILAMGSTVLMVSGGIDLSIGSGVSLTGVLVATVMSQGWSPLLAVPVTVVTMALLGGGTGFLVAKSSHHPFVLTLGLMTLFQGLTFLISVSPVTNIPDPFIDIVDWKPLGIPLVIFTFAVAVLCIHLTLTYTALGRWLYAIGSSENAARLSGIRINLVKVIAYAISGVLVGVAGVLMTAQLASAQPQMGFGLELAAIAAVAVGGTPLSGGRGDVLGTFLGVLLLALISNSLNLLSITSSWQYVLQGIVIVIAVLAQRKS